MNSIGKSERSTQNRVIQLFQDKLGYAYLGNWENGVRNQPVEEDLLKNYLTSQGYSEAEVNKAINKFMRSVVKLADGLYDANKKVYSLLRYGVNIRKEQGESKENIYLIDWDNPHNNNFAVAEEVSVLGGDHDKRPDVVIYVNGIALGVIELKNSRVDVSEGIRQNLDNQNSKFIQSFFTTQQLVMAGNDTQGLVYGTIETSEKYYLTWKESSSASATNLSKDYDYILDKHISQLCQKERFLELIHDFVVFDKGTKKLCRPNQYFGVKAAHQNVRNKQGGIIWHTQGSGKSLTMVWLTKWIRENVEDSRVLIITDREELDDQIEKLYEGVGESIYRTKSGRDLLSVLNEKKEMLVASLVHKFGRNSEEGDYESYINELKKELPSDFRAKGNITVFVDECHRTQSGKLHEAMKTILPDALFIGFTGTPLFKKDKQKSIEVFGPFIGNPYKFDEAVEDGVVLDLLYEARDVEQFVTDQKSIDEWFDAETKGLMDVAKIELKKKWGTMQKVLGSKSRLDRIVFDIIKDFKLKPRLANGEGNAMLVTSSVYQACRFYELFQNAGFKRCAIITSYQPHHADIKGESTGIETPTEKAHKYDVYTKMLNGKSTEDFEAKAKHKFIHEPDKMKLLIVVDKLLTGFDAPSATYLYIDKKMQDHGLFQAVCRVNRVAEDSKKYGYIIDYKDLFKSLEKSISDYTSEAFDQYDSDDVKGLLVDRIEKSKERLENALETLRALCETVHPKEEYQFIKFFCGNTENKHDLKAKEPKRVELYKDVVSLIRAYAEVANEMHKLGYNEKEALDIRNEVKYYSDLRDTIKIASREQIDLKTYEPGMRMLMDMYIDAKSSKKISDFDNQTLVDIIINVSEPESEYSKPKNKEAVAETIENNVRKVIIEEQPTNPKYYEKMSQLLDDLIRQRKNEMLDYEKYLKKIKELAQQVSEPTGVKNYPSSLDSPAKRALFDNLDQDEVLALALDNVIHANKLDAWRDGGIREKKLRLAVFGLLKDEDKTIAIMDIIKAQHEY